MRIINKINAPGSKKGTKYNTTPIFTFRSNDLTVVSVGAKRLLKIEKGDMLVLGEDNGKLFVAKTLDKNGFATSTASPETLVMSSVRFCLAIKEHFKNAALKRVLLSENAVKVDGVDFFQLTQLESDNSTVTDRYIEQIKDFYKKTGQVPKKRDVTNYNVITRHFGSWNEAIKQSGLTTRKTINQSKEDLLAELQAYYNQHRESPTVRDCYRKNGLSDYKTYLERLGVARWEDVLSMAKLPLVISKQFKYDLTDEDLLEKLKEYLKETNDVSVEGYHQKRGDLPSMSYIVNRLGLWTDIVKKLGFVPNSRKYNAEELKEAFLAAKDYYGYTPNMVELSDRTGFSSDYFRRKFGPYNDFVRSLGFEPKSETSVPDTHTRSELIALYKKYSLKNGYDNGAPSAALGKEGIPSVEVFDMRFGSINNLRKACGFSPVTRRGPIYTKANIAVKLKAAAKRLDRVPTQKDILEDPELPSLTTILRCFSTTAMRNVWKELGFKK